MTKPTVLIAEQLSPATIEALGSDFTVTTCDGANREDLLSSIAQADAILIRSATRLDAEAITAAPQLKVIARAGVGLDNVDIPAATRAGVMVVNAPTSNITSAAELTMAHLLAAARNFGAGHTTLKAGKWERSRLSGVELSEKTLGIIGLGRIGGLIAERAKAFGMRLIGYDPYISQSRAAHMGVEAMDLEQVLRQADFLTVHLPKTPETTGLIDAEALAKTKPGVRIVNVARGGIIDEAALAEALSTGRVAAAGIDVWAEEPPGDNPLLSCETANVTPHLGASTHEAQEKAGVAVAKSVRLALAGELVPDAVNVTGGAIHPDVRPGIELAERLGRLAAALITEPVAHYAFEAKGEIADKDVSVLQLSGLKGMFRDMVSTPVSYVNAPLMAEERGIDVELFTDEQSESFRNETSVVLTTTAGTKVSVSGTVMGPKHMQKLTAIDGFELEMQLTDYLLVFRYEDRPGVIGQLGQALGQNQVNIAAMQVARADSGEALSVMAVDSPVTPEVVADVAQMINASQFSMVSLAEG